MNGRWMKGLAFVAGLVLSTMSLPAQSGVMKNNANAGNAASDRGFFGRVLMGGGHDSLLGYAGDTEFSVGYDLNHALEFESGVPIYWLSVRSDVTPSRNRYGSLGDTFMKLEFAPNVKPFDYTAVITGTIPTGLRLVSTERGTWDFNNRLERSFVKPFNPFGEVIFGNVLPVRVRLSQDSTTGGVESQYKLGNSFQLVKGASLDAAFYEAIPLKGNNVINANGERIQLSDHGYIGSVLVSHGRWDLDVTYSRSITNRADAFWATLSHRLGHRRKVSSK